MTTARPSHAARLEAVNEELRTRNRQQSCVATLGQSAIRARDLGALMAEAAAVAAETLGTEHSAVLEVVPGGEELLLRAGRGWKEGLVGHHRVPASAGMAALLEQGVVNPMSVIIRGPAGPWGTLGVHTARPRSFSADDVGFLQSVANVLALAIERHEVEVARRQEHETLEAIFDTWISAHIDITERKRADAERNGLLESETAARAEAEAALERLRAIESITDSALRRLGLDELLRELLARLQRALDTDAATVFLLEEDGHALYPRAADGYELDASVRVRVGFGVTGLIAAKGHPLIEDDYSSVDVSGIEGVAESDLRAKVSSVMGVPLRIGDTVVGVVVVSSKRSRRFTAEELRLMGLVADRVAPAIGLGRLVERVRDGRERQEVLARRLLTAQEEERRRLAVELHDELGQVLTAVKINLESLVRQSGAVPAPAHLRDAIGSVDHALQRVRDLALDLRPSVLDDLGLPAALRWYTNRFARESHVELHLSIDAVPHLETGLETACFRVAQEALTNVARHAQARHVWLDLHLLAELLELSVRDDGIGFDPAAARARAVRGTSMGQLGMQERVSLAGGEFEVQSSPARGTTVRARFPIGERARSTA